MPKNFDKTQYAMRDIAYRSRVSSFLYLIIFAIIIAFTPFYSDYKSFIVTTGVALLIGTIIRGVFALNFAIVYKNNPILWMVFNEIGLLIQAGTWGVLSVMSIQYYAWQWTTMVICLSSAAFSAGAVITLSTSFRLTLLYLIFMFSPTLTISVINGSEENLIAAFLFTTYFIYLVYAAKRLNKEYWEALNNTQLLKQRARELEIKNRELESFAYSVSHDLRAPLRSIDGFSKLVLDDAWQKLDDSERRYLQRVRSAAQKMGNLIDDLLQLSKVSRAEYQPLTINLSRMVESNLEKLKQQNPHREIKLDIEPDIKATGDRSLLNIVVNNLVDNAWKYSSKKPYTKIRFGVQKQNGEIVYYIKDNGAGFDIRYVNKLFKPFHRLHTGDEFPGTGIGLATVYRVIDRHGGKIWANAKIGCGATFYFTIHSELHH